MKQFKQTTPFLLVFFVMAGARANAALSAHDIMSKNDDARKFQTMQSRSKMTTGGGGASERVKEFTMWRKLAPDGVHFKTLTRFHAPAEVKNEGILFLESGDGTDVQIYLPNFKKVRRVETGQQSGSFMGSEFSYSDIAAPHVDDYNYKLIREEQCPGANKDAKCWVIESTPANDGVRDRTGASKGTSWIRQDNYMAARIEYDDLNGAKWKSLDTSEIKEDDTKNHKWLAHNIRMEAVKTGKFTVLRFDDVKVNQPIPDSTFTVQNLSRE